MDAKEFAPSAPGRLVPALNKQRRPDTGFIPDPLPRRWEMPPQTRALLAQAREAGARLAHAGERFSAPQLAAAFLQLREAIRSSASNRPAGVTSKLLRFEATGGEHGEPVKAWRAAFHYRRVLRAAHEALAGGAPLALRALVQEIHAGLFEGRPRRGVFPGRLRRGPIQMGDVAHYVPPPYAWVVPCLSVLERDLARASEIDPLVRAFMTHYQFVSIHPFADGNGRVGRILLALMIDRATRGPEPLLYLSPFLAQHKRRYVGSLFRVNTHGEWQVWIDFCLKATIAEAAAAVKTLAALEALRKKTRSGALLDALIATPAFSEPQFAALCARLGRDARAELDRLRGAGIVCAARAKPKTRWYVLPEVVELLERDEAAASRPRVLSR